MGDCEMTESESIIRIGGISMKKSKLMKAFFVLTLIMIMISNTVLVSADISLDASDFEEQLFKDFQTFFSEYNIELDDIIYEHYGIYDECSVVWMSTSKMLDNDMLWDIPIGNYVFSFFSASKADRFYVYKDGTFTLVRDSYMKGWLSDEDIALLADEFNETSSVGYARFIDICWYYKDIRFDDWFHLYVDQCYEKKLMIGLDENVFGPYEILSRAQFATILSRMEELQSIPYDDIFNDVAEGEWYTEAVLWAAENDIVTGYENGCFGPSDTIIREQMAAMLYRYAKYKGYDTEENADLTEYPDATDVSDFASDAISWCVAKGIIYGNDGKLLPQGNTTRAECAAMISRFVNLYE